MTRTKSKSSFTLFLPLVKAGYVRQKLCYAINAIQCLLLANFAEAMKPNWTLFS